MSVPDHKEIGYECQSGHVNERHDVTLDGDYRDGKRPVCVECNAPLTRKLVPLYECEDCGNVWAYAGDAERPTCSNCRGKRVMPVSDE